MNPRHRSDLLTWVALLLAAALEFAVSFVSIPSGVRPILTAVSRCGDLGRAGVYAVACRTDIAKAFAIGGIFWLTVLLGLAMTDPMTRAVYAVAG